MIKAKFLKKYRTGVNKSICNRF